MLISNEKIIKENEKEIKILKGAVRALSKMALHYRLGGTTMPEWAFKNIEKAEKFYDTDDLTKI